MSELMYARNGGWDLRRQLLTTVSALTLLAAVYGSSESEAADQDADRPTVWIDLGGQLEQMSNPQQKFSPPFMESITQTSLLSALDMQKSPYYSIGGEGKLSFQPNGSDWIFSASIRYGRSNANTHRHQQIKNSPIYEYFTYSGSKFGPTSFYPNYHVKVADASERQSETHAILDFMAGKDVGLGMFGNQGSAVLSGGIRIAQFNSKSNVNMRAEPDVRYPTKSITSLSGILAFKYEPVHFHDYAAMANAERSFRGVGPSIAWDASMPLVGNPGRGQISFDWGANAAVLFGRQKASGHHQTTTRSYDFTNWHSGTELRGGYHPGHFGTRGSNVGPAAQRVDMADFNRMRAVTVPNLGGFAGASFLYSNAKVSLGYRADFFFGAMDGGIDVAKKENRGFYGPFASISVGLGG